MFPQRLDDSRAFAVARAMLEGFDRHYRLFRETSVGAKARFEAADWHGQQRAQAQRIEYYDRPAVRRIVRDAAAQDYRWSSIILGITRSPAFLMRASGTRPN